MSNNNKTPAIRFKGFTDTWEQRKFSELTEIRSASRVHKEEWQSSGVPFYRSSDVMAALNGTENEKAFISEELYEKLSAVSGKLEKGDILVTGGGSVGKPYIVPNNEPLYTKDADLLWVKNNEKLVPYFIYTFFFSPAFSDYLNSVSHVGTIAHYTITQLEETPITLPCVSEQQKIGDYFRNIDSLISLYQRKYDKLIQFKAAMLKKMFPQNGADKPEIRFKGFTDAWEQRKLGECAEFNPKSELPDIFEYVDLESVVGTDILSHRTESKSSAPSRAQRLAQKGDVFYQTVRPYQKNNCIFENDENNWVFSTGYAQLRPVNDGYFLLTLLQNEDFVKLVLDRCTGTSYPAINSNDLADIDVNIPINNLEQQRIGDYFRNLDSLITLHQRKCDKYKSIKSGLIRKLFP